MITNQQIFITILTISIAFFLFVAKEFDELRKEVTEHFDEKMKEHLGYSKLAIIEKNENVPWSEKTMVEKYEETQVKIYNPTEDNPRAGVDGLKDDWHE